MNEQPLREALGMIASGKPGVAVEVLRPLAARGGTVASALLAIAHGQMGQGEPALFQARRAAADPPADPQLATALMRILAAGGAWEELLRCAELMARRQPGSTLVLDARVAALLGLGRFGQVAALESEIAVRLPDSFETVLRVAAAYRWLLRPDLAVSALERFAQRHPDHAAAWSCIAQQLNYTPGATVARSIDAHIRFARALRRVVGPPLPAPAPEPRATQGPIRLGIISADLCTHSVAFFLRGLFEHLPRERVRLLAYFTGPRADRQTEFLRTHADGWVDAYALDPAQLTSRIRADGVEVLIETNGPADGSRLGTLALRPARVQVSYCGYPSALYADFIDARLIDAHTDPDAQPPEVEAARSVEAPRERLVRIPGCFLHYAPPAEAPSPRPPRAGESIMFGSFNQAYKLNGPLVALWARVLKAVPGSRLMLKAAGLAGSEAETAARAMFTEAGIAPDRIEISPWQPRPEQHLALYERIDIALDTFPYHGTTTTCEALWMGVPVVTLAGDRHAARVGVSLLHAVGLGELVAEDEDGYVQRAVALASDEPRRASLRSALRTRVAGSPLCDGPGFGAKFAGVIESLAGRRA